MKQTTPEAVEAEARELAKIHQPRATTTPVKAKERNRAHSERFTGPGQALAALRAKMRSSGTAPEKLYRCGKCLDSGWWEIDATGRGTVKRCPNGCEPPRPRAVRSEQPAGAKKPGSFS